MNTQPFPKWTRPHSMIVGARSPPLVPVRLASIPPQGHVVHLGRAQAVTSLSSRMTTSMSLSGIGPPVTHRWTGTNGFKGLPYTPLSPSLKITRRSMRGLSNALVMVLPKPRLPLNFESPLPKRTPTALWRDGGMRGAIFIPAG